MTIGVETIIEKGSWPIAADFIFRVLVTDDGEPTGTPVDVSSFSPTLIVRRKDSNKTLVFQKDASDFNSVNGTNDAADFLVLVADTVGEEPGWVDWAVWRGNAGAIHPIAFGTAFLTYVPLLGA